jgi:hypothetical protein
MATRLAKERPDEGGMSRRQARHAAHTGRPGFSRPAWRMLAPAAILGRSMYEWFRDRPAAADLERQRMEDSQTPDVMARPAPTRPHGGGSAWRCDGRVPVTAARAKLLCSRDTGDSADDPNYGSVGCSANTSRIRQRGWLQVWAVSWPWRSSSIMPPHQRKLPQSGACDIIDHIAQGLEPVSEPRSTQQDPVRQCEGEPYAR